MKSIQINNQNSILPEQLVERLSQRVQEFKTQFESVPEMKSEKKTKTSDKKLNKRKRKLNKVWMKTEVIKKKEFYIQLKKQEQEEPLKFDQPPVIKDISA